MSGSAEPLPRVAVAITWSRKRRPLRAPLGILVIDSGRVSVLDRDGDRAFGAAVGDLVAAADGRQKLRLQAAEDVVYVAGLAVQEARSPATRDLIDRHRAQLVAPRPPSISEASWKRTLGASTLGGSPADVRVQKIVWQATLLAGLEMAGAAVERTR